MESKIPNTCLYTYIFKAFSIPCKGLSLQLSNVHVNTIGVLISFYYLLWQEGITYDESATICHKKDAGSGKAELQ